MKLPDFRYFDPFNNLREKMGADQLGRFSLFDHRIHLAGWEREALDNGGLSVSLSQVRGLEDKTLAHKNSRVLVFLSSGEVNTYHLAECAALHEARVSLELDHCKVATALVDVDSTEVDSTNAEENLEGKDFCVCGDCLQTLGYEGFDRQRNRRRAYSEQVQSSFSLVGFFKQYPVYPLDDKPDNFIY